MLLSRLIRFVFLLCAITLLSACDNNTSNKNIDGTKTLLDNADIVLSEAGIGSINAQTPFNIHQITEAFQAHKNYHVDQLQTQEEGIDYPVIRVSKGADIILLINPELDQSKIFSIVVKDPKNSLRISKT